MKKILIGAFVSVAGASFAGTLNTYYDFNGNLNPTLNLTGFAQALEYRTGNSSGTSLAGTVNYTSELVGSVNKQVASFTAPEFFRSVHGIGKNGGGSYLNQYAILLDLKIASAGWVSLYNTTDNAGNDGDAFIDPTDGLGISGDYGGSFVRNQWNRVIISVDTLVPKMSIYLNGSLANEITLGSGVDGRWSAFTLDDGDATADWIDIFADNDGDNGSGKISALGFFDGAITANDAAALGGAGQPVPEPATIAALSLGAAALVRRKKNSQKM